MRVVLRIAVILLSAAIVVYALIPDKKPAPAPAAPTTSVAATPAATPAASSPLRDLLGGAAVDAGRKARDEISAINLERQSEIKDAEAAAQP